MLFRENFSPLSAQQKVLTRGSVKKLAPGQLRMQPWNQMGQSWRPQSACRSSCYE